MAQEKRLSPEEAADEAAMLRQLEILENLEMLKMMRDLKLQEQAQAKKGVKEEKK